MKTITAGSSRVAAAASARGGARGWQRWAPYAALAWSLVYAALGLYWAAGGRGFPYGPEATPDLLGPLVLRLGPAAAWIVVMAAGAPAAALGAAMLLGAQDRALRPFLITAGALLSAVLLLLMTGLGLLVNLGYVPYGLVALLRGDEFGQIYLELLTEQAVLHQLLCLVGGFLWLAATVCYARRSAGACLSCGRRDGPPGWQSPERAARWGRAAVYVSLAAPVFYALTRIAWALGIPLGMSMAYLRQGQERGTWISGLSLAVFGLVGAALTLGLVQRWGEVFPRWMPILAGRRVPIALAVVPALLVAVLLVVGGVGIWSGLAAMAANLAAAGEHGAGLVAGIVFQLGPTLLFPLWGAALAAAALGYAYRRRGPCGVCGRGAPGEG